MFRGRYEHTIDAKGRTSLPARYRDVLSSIGERRVILTSALDPCLVAYTAAEWVWTEETGEEADVPDFVHATVMRTEVTSALLPRAGVYVDATVGGGGHSEAILDAHPAARVVALDRDHVALDAARARLAR